MESSHPSPIRDIKSFVLRQGRLTKGQQYAMEHYWPLYGVAAGETPLDWQQLFGNDAPLALEIGFGNGESLAAMAQAEPARNFIGIEVHTPGVGHLLHLIADQQLSNLRVMNSDAVQIIRQQIPAASLDRVQVYFPDPWHKKRHHKRRIVQAPFVSLLASRLCKGGLLHLATDWEDYAHHMADVMQASPDFKSCAADGAPFSPRPAFRPQTKFEQRGLRLGHGVWDLLYYKS